MVKNVVSYLMAQGKFVNKTHNLPEAVPYNYVRVKYIYCGICGGDYSRYLGYRSEYPISLGHEFVAQVINTNCETSLDYEIGDFVVSDFNYRCMRCSYCQNKKTHLCVKNDIGKFSNRAFALYADIHYSYLVKTNIFKSYIYRAAMVEPLSCVIHAMDFYDLSKIESILIYGTGSIGMLSAFYLSQCKKKKVFLYDTYTKRMNIIAELFACKDADFFQTYDLIIEATNSSDGLLECISKTRTNSNICSFSHLYGQDTKDIYNHFVRKESSVYFPLRNGSQNTLYRAMQNIEANWLQSYDSLIKIYNTDNVNLAFEDKDKCIEPKQIIHFSVVE